MKVVPLNKLEDFALRLLEEWKSLLDKTKGPFHMALSGGSTPLALFDYFSSHPVDLPWERIHFWWGDERLVELDSKESNGGEALRRWLSTLPLKKEQIHLAGGSGNEQDLLEAYREQQKILPQNAAGSPYYHWVWLGLGEDGHCASLFPDFAEWDSDEDLCICTNPYNGQKRISFTPSLISRSERVTFIVRGKSKAPVLAEILQKTAKGKQYPAGRIDSLSPQTEWLCDKEALSIPDDAPDRG